MGYGSEGWLPTLALVNGATKCQGGKDAPLVCTCSSMGSALGQPCSAQTMVILTIFHKNSPKLMPLLLALPILPRHFITFWAGCLSLGWA